MMISGTAAIAILFTKQGHDIRTARNGGQAIQRARAFCPHLILLNLAMPLMNAFQFANELRPARGLERCVLVAVTGSEGTLDRRHCAEADFDLYLSKPVETDVLEHLPLFSQDLYELIDKHQQLAFKQSQSILSLVGAGIQMANAFVDSADTAKSPVIRERCLFKAEKTQQAMTRLVHSTAPERVDLIAALDELRWRYKRLRL
jgi:CheY-like chemotaxis protein